MRPRRELNLNKNVIWLIPLLSITILLLLIGALTTPAPAAELQDLPYDRVVVRAYFSDSEMVVNLASWTAPWEVDYELNFVVLDVNAEEYERLEADGFQVIILAELTDQLNNPLENLPGQVSGIPGFLCYRTVEETYTTAENIVASYPDLATWIDIGDSWEKSMGLGGYDLMVLKITNTNVSGPKPKLFMMSSIHAREYTPAELNTRFAEFLTQQYDLDPDVTWLLDYHEIHFLLQANPDGRKHAELGENWRKNTNQNYCGPTSSFRGADLNRNFQFQWGCCGGASSDECHTQYRGPSAASEPETQAIQNYVSSIYPDLRDADLTAAAPITTTGIFLDLHSYSELLLWPWGFTTTITTNGLAMQTLGRKLAYFNGYRPEQAINLYPTDGTTDDFAYGELGLPAFTYELGSKFFESCNSFENNILPDNLESLIYAAKAVRAPYLSPAGPDVLEPSLSSGTIGSGGLVTLTVTLDDTRYEDRNGVEPSQTIAGAEVYLDIPGWITTTTPVPLPMTPQDGAFDTEVEVAEFVIDTSGLSSGRHSLFIRGQDVSGNWGVYSAIFLQILDLPHKLYFPGFYSDWVPGE